jgi:hypothetical protein
MRALSALQVDDGIFESRYMPNHNDSAGGAGASNLAPPRLKHAVCSINLT